MAQPIGNFDSVDPASGCIGWAIDPDTPSAAVTVHFYANQPAGTTGTVFLGSTVANLPRPDVNQATGYPGNHGFNWLMPLHFLSPCRPRVYAYAIDTSGTGVNPLLHGSPLTMPYLLTSIDNGVGVIQKPIVVSNLAPQFATSISALTWNGLQFINTLDHGRLLSAAAQYYISPGSWGPECYNPTEGGSIYDNKNQAGCSTTQILSITKNGSSQLNTECLMAFYGVPGQNSDGCATAGGAVNTHQLSDVNLKKSVTINVNGNPSIISLTYTFTAGSEEYSMPIADYEVIACYLNEGTLSQVFLYNQSTQATSQVSYSNNSTEVTEPVIICSADKNYAMGIYTPHVPPGSYINAAYDYAGSAGDYLKLGFIVRTTNQVAGNSYTYHGYLIVDTFANVVSAIGSLITYDPN